jgi:hypothetical protein
VPPRSGLVQHVLHSYNLNIFKKEINKEKIIKTLKEKERSCDYSLHQVSRFIQPSLLLFLSRRPVHGYQLIEDLKGLGFHENEVDIGAIYRNLRKLEEDGYVVSSWVKGESDRFEVRFGVGPN